MSGQTVFVALQQFCEDSDAPRQELLRAGFQIQENRTGRRLRREELPDLLRAADAVLAGVEPYNEDLFKGLARLRCISRCGVGTDTIDLEAARARGIAVLTTSEEVVEPVAQMTVAMILALARNLHLHGSDFQRGEWKKRTGHLLSEWTVGLVGFGRIGRAVHRLLQPFACGFLVHDPKLSGKTLPAAVRNVSLEVLLAESDLVSVHAARAPGEGPLLGKREFSLMRPGSRLVNTARGHLVDEEALCEALESGRLSGAALDVFHEEPYWGKLTRLPQVLCTPHVSSLTARSRVEMELRCARNVVEFFSS